MRPGASTLAGVVGTEGLSGLIVEIPEAEPIVGRHRAALDPNARLGVPAHVTVLFPFLPPARLDHGVLKDLGALFSDLPAFEVTFTSLSWFDRDVLWLAPEDPRPFLTLTWAVHHAFPGFPPYGGEHADPAPHLTVAHSCAEARMQAAARQITPLLPVSSVVREVTLMTQPGTGGHWSRRASFALASPQVDDAGPA
jgi:hypothetical protein